MQLFPNYTWMCVIIYTIIHINTVVFLMTSILWYSAITDLTFGNLCGHIYTEIDHFCLKIPEALINLLKHCTKI